MAIGKIDNKTLRQKVYDELRESIMSAEMEPGQVFSLRELADKLGVSIMPVREALWQLETEKIVVIESNKRMQINTLSPSEIQELFAIRLYHETKLIEKSCIEWSKKTVDRLEVVLSKMIQANIKNHNYLHWNKEFHFAIYNNAKMPITLTLVNNLWLRLAPYFSIRTPNSTIYTNLEPHRIMFEAYKNNDCEACLKGFTADLSGTKTHILSMMAR
ncbi:MAG: GntR family transcriptional regulator [Bacteroidetes bacterium]|nr:GntR family transcriptional regulator [Bacteroidota bacterium]